MRECIDILGYFLRVHGDSGNRVYLSLKVPKYRIRCPNFAGFACKELFRGMGIQGRKKVVIDTDPGIGKEERALS